MMNLPKLFSCQMFLLVSLYRGSQSQQIRINIPNVELWYINDPRSVIYTNKVLIKVSEDQDEYFFEDQELAGICGGRFTSENVEITSAYDYMLTFSLITADKNLTMECIFHFATLKDLHSLFSQLRKTLVIEGSSSVSVSKSMTIRADGRLIPLTTDGLLYRKLINKPEEVGATYSYNLVRQFSRLHPQTGATIQTQEVGAVFMSRRFNITRMIGNDTVGICPTYLPDGSFIMLRFTDSQSVTLFMSIVRNDIDPTINCSIDDAWAARLRHISARPIN